MFMIISIAIGGIVGVWAANNDISLYVGMAITVALVLVAAVVLGV